MNISVEQNYKAGRELTPQPSCVLDLEAALASRSLFDLCGVTLATISCIVQT